SPPSTGRSTAPPTSSWPGDRTVRFGIGRREPGYGAGMETDEILAFARRRPPFASVVVRTDTATEDGRQRVGTEWRNLRRDLEAQGATAELLAAIDAAVDEHRQPGGLAVI